MAKVIELDVGESRIIDGKAIEVVEFRGRTKGIEQCDNCAFRDINCEMLACLPWERSDNKSVYFKPLGK